MATSIAILMCVGVLVFITACNTYSISNYSRAFFQVGFFWWVFPILLLGLLSALNGRLAALGLLLICIGSSISFAVLFAVIWREDPLAKGMVGGTIGLLIGGAIAAALH